MAFHYELFSAIYLKPAFKSLLIFRMEKILTIVIPTYNMQDYLRRCLDSLIVPDEQMQQLEVLVVNDGSKDNSSAIAHEYQDKYPGTFRVIDKEMATMAPV